MRAVPGFSPTSRSIIGGIPKVWSAGVLVGAGVIAAINVLLAHVVSPTAVLALYGGAVSLWVAVRFRVGVLVLLLLCLPLGRLTFAELGPVPLSPVTALVFLLAAILIWRLSTSQDAIKLSWLQVPLALFLLCALLSVYGAPDPTASIKTLFVFGMGTTVYVFTSQMVRTQHEVRGVLWAVACAAAAMGLYAVTDQVFGFGSDPDVQISETGGSYSRAAGLFSHPNQLGGFLALVIPPATALALSEPAQQKRVLGYLLVAMATAGLILTYSRGAWMGTAVALLVMLLVLRRGFWGFFGLLLVGAPFASGVVLERLSSIAAPGSDPAVAGRLEIWGATLRMITEHPLLGVGIGNFQAAYGNLMIYGLPLLQSFDQTLSMVAPNHAHNLILHVAAEIGLMGLAAFVSLLLIAFFKALRFGEGTGSQARTLKVGVAAGLGAMLIHNLAEVTFYQGFNVLLFFTYLGLLDVIGRPSDAQEIE